MEEEERKKRRRRRGKRLLENQKYASETPRAENPSPRSPFDVQDRYSEGVGEKRFPDGALEHGHNGHGRNGHGHRGHGHNGHGHREDGHY